MWLITEGSFKQLVSWKNFSDCLQGQWKSYITSQHHKKSAPLASGGLLCRLRLHVAAPTMWRRCRWKGPIWVEKLPAKHALMLQIRQNVPMVFRHNGIFIDSKFPRISYWWAKIPSHLLSNPQETKKGQHPQETPSKLDYSLSSENSSRFPRLYEPPLYKSWF